MTKSTFVYVTYIATTPEKVWGALLDGEMTKDYWGMHRNVSHWAVGSTWEHQDYDDPKQVAVRGKVVAFEPPRKLAMTWESSAGGPPSRVTFDIVPMFGAVRLTVTHDDLPDDAQMVREGWTAILSSLKTLLETGAAMPMTKQRWPAPPPR
jgi:uncharacterized protein YndB with AHSA1/START domain